MGTAADVAGELAPGPCPGGTAEAVAASGLAPGSCLEDTVEEVATVDASAAVGVASIEVGVIGSGLDVNVGGAGVGAMAVLVSAARWMLVAVLCWWT